MKEELTVAQEAYELLKDIPEDKWITNAFTNKDGCGCLIGHYTRLKSNDPEDYTLDNCSDWNKYDIFDGGPLRIASRDFLNKNHQIDWADAATVNNDPKVNGYNQPKVKDRAMALLKDMIKAGY